MKQGVTMFNFKEYTVPNWFTKPMIWAQLTLTDDDPGTFDPDRWLAYFKAIKAQGMVLSTGGYIAYHPSKIPMHYVSPKINKDNDVFGYMVEAARKMGMSVIARTDPHAVHDEQKQAHPEWIGATEDGKPRPHWSMKGAWVTCPFGPMNFSFMTQVNNEIVEMYGVDGIFSNRWAGSGLCYCENCRKLFRERKGKELPKKLELSDPSYKDYVDFVQERLFELCLLWDGEIKKISPYARFIPNSGGGALSGLDMRWLGDYSDILFADRQARSGVLPPWANGKNGKEYRAVMGNKPIGGVFSMGIEEPYRWKDSVQTSDEIRLYVSDGVAQGLLLWFTKFHGKIYDRRWMDTVKDLYLRYGAWEPYLRNKKNLARVGLVYSQTTAKYYGGEKARQKVEDPIQGVYQALTESRVPFEMIHESDLDKPEKLGSFKAIILPNIACLSDAQCEGIKKYVSAGGSLLATYESSLYDERGNKRNNFGLAELFGVDNAGEIQGPMKNSYLRLDMPSAHPVLEGFGDTDRIINGIYRIPVNENTAFKEKPVTLIPPYPDLPMEEVYPRQDHTGIAELYLREYGSGRVAYFPWDIDRAFWEIMTADHMRLFINTLDWAAKNEGRPITLTGYGVFDTAVWEQEKSMTVHLVNMTNPMFMKGPCRELIPSYPQELSVLIPEGKAPASVTLLSSGKNPEFAFSNGLLKLSVPSFLDHEVVAIDLRSTI
ncbi:beta-galactosidase trimerization domain-containing protein [Treponema sp. OttesenSCG-928-L16]|nr:beta-galactosidase trimerization domain-containing protein [Treponema sp. OttesenSCG-928-L16]